MQACRITGRVHGQVYEQDVTREEAAAICGTEDAEGCSNEPDAQPGAFFACALRYL